MEEYKEYGEAAGLDKIDCNNVARWIATAEGAANDVGSRSGKAAAVADALTRKGVSLDREAELAVASALLNIADSPEAAPHKATLSWVKAEA